MLTGLLKRRVPQILGLYLGAAWVIVEFISFLTERYLLSPALTDFVLVSLLTMLPTVALIAWFHGTPGKDTWAPTEKVLIPINIIIAAGVLFALFGGEELGATTTTVTATDEQGATVTRVVPKPQYRESIALFSFSNDGRTLNWLRYGIPIALSRDLQQNPYIAAWSPLDGYEQNRLLDLQRAGYGDALDVPVPLMRNIASKNNLAYMLTGNFSSGLRGGLRLEAFLYRTDSGAAPKRFDIFGADPGDVVDRLSSEIRRYLDIYSGGDTLGTDLPVAEHFSTSNAAIERYVDAVVLSAIENDSLGAIDVLGEVAEIDPSFAAAAVHRAVLAANNGQTEAAREALALATQHNYRLLPDETFLVKALTYYTRGDVAKMLSVYEMHAELYPGDIHALSRLAYSYIYHANDIDRALATFQQIYELDNSLDWVVSQIASLQRVQGDEEAAIATLNTYSRRRPDDYSPLLSLGRIHLGNGDLSAARSYTERAVLLATGRVDPLLQMARIELREGNYDQAKSRIAEARAIVAAPRQESAVIAAEIEYFAQRGMLEELGQRLDELYRSDQAFRGAVNLLMTTVSDHAAHYYAADMGDVYFERLEANAAKLEPPLNELIHVGYLGYYLEQGDVAAAEKTAALVVELVDRFGRDDLAYLNNLASARIYQLKGDTAAAIESAQRSLDAFASSVHSIETAAHQVLIRNMLGQLHMDNGDLEAAEQVLEEVLRIFPGHPTTNVLLAEIAIRRNNFTRAENHLDVSLRAWQNAPASYTEARRARALVNRLESG